MGLDDRKKLILFNIVSLYERAGEPVGSTLLSNHIGITISTATLRAEMATLTRLGFLQQPHTSAGRIPSTAGYRYYLDNLLQNSAVPRAHERQIDYELISLDRQSDRFMRGTAKILAALLNLPAFATLPWAADMKIAHFKLLRVGKNNVCIVGVSAEGNTYTYVVRVEKQLSEQFLQKAQVLVNESLCFVSRTDVETAYAGLKKSEIFEDEIVIPIFVGAVNIIRELAEPVVYFEGLDNLAQLSQEGVSLEWVLKILGKPREFIGLLVPAQECGGVLLCDNVTGVKGLSVVCQSYHAGGGLVGRIGVLGPERISYTQTVSTTKYLANKISEILIA